MTAIDYKGYRIEVSPIGKGWRASIFSARTDHWLIALPISRKVAQRKLLRRPSALSMRASVPGLRPRNKSYHRVIARTLRDEAGCFGLLLSPNGENVSLPLSKHRPNSAGWSADEVTDDNEDDTYQSFACAACTRVHLVNLKTGKVLGEGEDYGPAAMLDRATVTFTSLRDERGLGISYSHQRVLVARDQ